MIPFHPLADIFPLIEGHDFDELVADIRAHGLREPIVLLEGKILDGRNRYRACRAAGILPESLDELTVTQLRLFRHHVPIDAPSPSRDELLAFVLSKNLHRRQLNESQRGMVAAKIANLKVGDNQYGAANLPDHKESVSQATAAKIVNVSERTVRDAVVVEQQAAPELKAAVEQGHLAVSVAAKAVTLPVQEQRTIADKARAGDVNAARNVVKEKARFDNEKRLGDKQRALPDKRYGAILADPEWRFEPYSRETGLDRAADNHYPTSATDVIASRPVQTIAADDCVLFLWATSPMLEHAFRVLNAWGFSYRSQFVWVKDRLGTGYWNRNRHELLLVGVRGNPPAPSPAERRDSVIDAPAGEHSAKPEIVFEYIEGWYPTLPKIELNRRGPSRPGWDAWGNESESSEAAA